MTGDPGLEPVTSWAAPAWATRSDVEGGIVVHVRPVAEVRLLSPWIDDEYVVDGVEVSQTDHVVVEDDGSVRVEREAPEVLAGGMRLDASEARRLAAALVVAADILDGGLVAQAPAVDR